MRKIFLFSAIALLSLVSSAGAEIVRQGNMIYERLGDELTVLKRSVKEMGVHTGIPAEVPTEDAIGIITAGKGAYVKKDIVDRTYERFSVPIEEIRYVKTSMYYYSGKNKWKKSEIMSDETFIDWRSTMMWVLMPALLMAVGGAVYRMGMYQREKHEQVYLTFLASIAISFMAGALIGKTTGVVTGFIVTLIAIVVAPGNFITAFAIAVSGALTGLMAGSYGYGISLRYILLMAAITSGAYLFNESLGIISDRFLDRKRELLTNRLIMADYYWKSGPRPCK